jgi:hypothetical protein
MPATLSTAAEKHAQALRLQLLESTELAAKKIVGQTRAEGERRIEVAGRQAQAIAETVSAVERAEKALAERAKAFGEASRSLRHELKAFAETLARAEEKLAPRAAEEPELRLVEAPPQEEFEAEDEDEPAAEAAPIAEAEPIAKEDEPPTPEQIARYFREAEEAELARAARPEQATKAERVPKRDRLYTDIGGAIIGLGGAAALINFVLLK